LLRGSQSDHAAKTALGAEHLTKLADWISSAEWLTDSFYPLKAFVKAVEAYGAIDPQESALRSSVERVARLLRSSHQKDLPKLSQQIETVLGGAAAATAELSSQPQEFSKSPYPDPFIPAAVGSPNVLVQLKQYLGMVPRDEIATTEIGLDHFPLRSDSPLSMEHEMINHVFFPKSWNDRPITIQIFLAPNPVA